MPDFPLNDLFAARFVRGGRAVRTGLDCQGLLIEVMRRYGYRVGDAYAADYAAASVAAAIGEQRDTGRWLPLDAPEEGCAVLLALDPERPDLPQHLGVCIGGGNFIHILEKRGVVVSALSDRFFAGKIRGFYRWVG